MSGDTELPRELRIERLVAVLGWQAHLAAVIGEIQPATETDTVGDHWSNRPLALLLKRDREILAKWPELRKREAPQEPPRPRRRRKGGA